MESWEGAETQFASRAVAVKAARRQYMIGRIRDTYRLHRHGSPASRWLRARGQRYGWLCRIEIDSGTQPLADLAGV